MQSKLTISFIKQLVANKVMCEFTTNVNAITGIITTFIDNESAIVINKTTLIDIADIVCIKAYDWEYVSDLDELPIDECVVTLADNAATPDALERVLNMLYEAKVIFDVTVKIKHYDEFIGRITAINYKLRTIRYILNGDGQDGKMASWEDIECIKHHGVILYEATVL